MEQHKAHHLDRNECARESEVMDMPVLNKERAKLVDTTPAEVSWQDKLTNGDPPELIMWGSDMSAGGVI